MTFRSERPNKPNVGSRGTFTNLIVVLGDLDISVEEDCWLGHVELEAQYLKYHQFHPYNLVERIRVVSQA